jgi:F5/8 type C domain
MKNVHLRKPGAPLLLATPLLGCSSSSGAAPGRDAGYLRVDASGDASGGDGTPGVDAAPSTDASGDAGEASSPTTVSKDNPYYLYSYEAGECCHWTGPLWPYATTQTLKGMANLLNDYTQSYVTKDDYFRLLDAYAKSQYKNGIPYVAEALDPNDTTGAPIWTYDTPAHSEHYNHSGFVDPVITGLIGFHPSADDVVRASPLTPDAWDHFMLENVAYHGHYLTIVWDADGSHYGAGTGFTIFEDCAVLTRQASLGPVQVPLQNGAWPPHEPPRLNNVFSNAGGATYPQASASYTFSYDDVDEVNDGIILYDRSVNGSPNNANVRNRWTNYSSPNPTDWVQIDMGAPSSIGEVTLHVYDDGIGVVPPTAYSISTSTDGTSWQPVGQVQMVPPTPAAGPNVTNFAPVAARYVRVTFSMSSTCTQGTGCVGLTEIEAWVTP